MMDSLYPILFSSLPLAAAVCWCQAQALTWPNLCAILGSACYEILTAACVEWRSLGHWESPCWSMMSSLWWSKMKLLNSVIAQWCKSFSGQCTAFGHLFLEVKPWEQILFLISNWSILFVFFSFVQTNNDCLASKASAQCHFIQGC